MDATQTKFKNQNRILVNCDHVGPTATEEETKALVAAMQERGWNVGYGDNGHWRLSADERADFDADWDSLVFAQSVA